MRRALLQVPAVAVSYDIATGSTQAANTVSASLGAAITSSTISSLVASALPAGVSAREPRAPDAPPPTRRQHAARRADLRR